MQLYAAEQGWEKADLGRLLEPRGSVQVKRTDTGNFVGGFWSRMPRVPETLQISGTRGIRNQTRPVKKCARSIYGL
jgi:hypothetical protein